MVKGFLNSALVFLLYCQQYPAWPFLLRKARQGPTAWLVAWGINPSHFKFIFAYEYSRRALRYQVDIFSINHRLFY